MPSDADPDNPFLSTKDTYFNRYKNDPEFQAMLKEFKKHGESEEAFMKFIEDGRRKRDQRKLAE